MKKSVCAAIGLVSLGLFAAGSVSAGSIQSHIAAYSPEDCKPVVDHVIAEKKIKEDNISKIQYLTDYVTMGETGEVFNYQAWFSFKNCPGNYVVNMNNACQILTTWSTNGCQLDRIATTENPKE